MPIKIVETSEFDLDKPVLIEGFPGIGLVGTISTTYLVDKLKMEPLGHIVSEKFPPLAAIHNHIPLHPARIYKSKKHNLVVLFSEFIIPLHAIYELSREILQWSAEHKVSRIFSLGGIVMKGEQNEVFGIASTKELLAPLEAKKIKLIKEGATTGVSGVLLAECAAINFPAISLLAESKPEYMDPKAAAMVLDALKSMIGLELDTTELVNESKQIEGKMKELMASAKTSHDHYKSVEEAGAMYG